MVDVCDEHECRVEDRGRKGSALWISVMIRIGRERQ